MNYDQIRQFIKDHMYYGQMTIIVNQSILPKNAVSKPKNGSMSLVYKGQTLRIYTDGVDIKEDKVFNELCRIYNINLIYE